MRRLQVPRWHAPGWVTLVAAGAVSAALMGVRLFVPQPVAMANNGDAQRLMCQIHADAARAPASSAQWYFVRFHYAFMSHHSRCIDYPTTQYLQLRLTAFVHRHLLGLSGAIDTRELMVEYCVLVGIVIALMAWLLRPVRLPFRIGLLTALFLVLADATFADYAGSPYSETTALYGLLVVAVAGVIAVGSASDRGRVIAFLTASAAAVFAVGAKNETVTLLIPLAALLGTRRVPIGRLRGRLGVRALPALCVVALLATAGWSMAHESREDQEINTAQEVTMTLMPMVSDPGQVAVDFGLPRSFGKYSGTNWWSANPIENDPAFKHYRTRFSRSNLVRYFAENPAMSARVFSGGADSYLTFRANYLGNYAANAGQPPQHQECRVCFVQSASHALKWSGFPGILGYWLACLAGAAWLMRTGSPGSRRRGFGLVTLTLIGCTVIQYATAVFGEGNEVTKHLAVALFTATLAPVWIAAGALMPRSASEKAAQLRLLRFGRTRELETTSEPDPQPTAL